MKKSPLAVAPVGFSGQGLSMLELFLNREQQRYQQVDPITADAIIYNADQPVPLETQQQQYFEEYDKPGLILSVAEVSWPGMIAVRKPFSLEALSSALERLALARNSGCYDQDQSQQGHEQILAVFREQIRGGRGEHSTALQQFQQQGQRRKQFQRQLLARKRSAEQVLERIRSSSPTDIYPEPAPKKPLEADILTTTEEPVVEQLLRIETPAAEPPLACPELLPASTQEIRDCCGSSPDLKLNVRSQRRRLIFNPEGQLLSLVEAAIQRAHQEQSSVAITGLSGKELVYQPDIGKFCSDIDDDFLVQMAHVRFGFGELQLQLVSEARIDRMRLGTDFAWFPARQLLWKLACWSSRGRIIAGLDLDASYQLTQRPDTGLLIGLPHTLKLIDLWLAEALTAQQVIDRLGARQRYVFPFMTAAWVLGWLQKQ